MPDSRDERFQATYRLRCAPSDIEARAQSLALEQSVEMPLDAIGDARVLREVVARVDAIEHTADGAFLVRLALSAETLGDDVGQWMNMLFGNCSLQPDVELVDVGVPPAALRHMPGPRFGIEGWRAATSRVAGAARSASERTRGAGDAVDARVAAADRRADHARPLTCTALKPQGLDATSLAALAYRFARAGVDVVKDDHGIADQRAAPFAQRVPSVQRAIERANAERAADGDPRRTLYAPSLSGGPRALARQLAIVRDEGVGAVLACPMLIGLPTFVDVVRGSAGVPILAHPAMAGAARIEPAVLLGRLFRLAGADATIFPHAGGRFSYTPAQCRALVRAAREPLGDVAPTLPVPAGGMRVERVDELVGEYGPDTMLLIGGDLLRAGDALGERTRAFVRRVADAGLPQPLTGVDDR